MFESILRVLRRKHDVPERIRLTIDGFELLSGDEVKWRIWWSEVDKIEVFKEDLITYDLVCMEFFVGVRDMVFPLNEELEGFWEIANRIKEVFPTSSQDWEAAVVKPAFARNPAIIYERASGGPRDEDRVD